MTGLAESALCYHERDTNMALIFTAAAVDISFGGKVFSSFGSCVVSSLIFRYLLLLIWFCYCVSTFYALPHHQHLLLRFYETHPSPHTATHRLSLSTMAL